MTTDSTPSADELVRASSADLARGVCIAEVLLSIFKQNTRLARNFTANMIAGNRPDLAKSTTALEGYPARAGQPGDGRRRTRQGDGEHAHVGKRWQALQGNGWRHDENGELLPGAATPGFWYPPSPKARFALGRALRSNETFLPKVMTTLTAPFLYKLTDGGGLYVEVYPTGGKLWRLKYRFGGKETITPVKGCGARSRSPPNGQPSEARCSMDSLTGRQILCYPAQNRVATTPTT